jgi:hypothetical protein
MTPMTRPQREALFRRDFLSCWDDEAPVFGQQVLPRLWHDCLEDKFFRRLMRGLGSFLKGS